MSQTIQSTVERMLHWVDQVPGRLQSRTEEELAARRSPSSWSKKEILGHLCDSATNNLQRFVKAQLQQQPYEVVPYEQDEWVRIQQYQTMPTADIIGYWAGLNRHLAHTLACLPEHKLQQPCRLASGTVVSLQFLIEDYVTHLEHHLLQLFEGERLATTQM